MDNQHRQIKGYRELNAEEIALMNEIKSKGAELGELVAKLRAVPDLDQHRCHTPAGRSHGTHSRRRASHVLLTLLGADA